MVFWRIVGDQNICCELKIPNRSWVIEKAGEHNIGDTFFIAIRFHIAYYLWASAGKKKLILRKNSCCFKNINYLKYIQAQFTCCLLYTSDAADERSSVDLGGRRIIKKQTRA